MVRQSLILAVSAVLAMAGLPALAGSPESGAGETVLALPVETAKDPGLVFTLGLGVAAKPAYFGSDEYVLGPSGSFTLHHLGLGSLRFGDPDPRLERQGFGLRGSFRYIGERDASEYSELAGLNDVDAALELGLGVAYTARNFEIFADARRGFGGHEAWVAEAGIDLIARPSDSLRLSAGPRLFWGQDDYAATYFGVTAAEASPALPAYTADGGLLSTGIEIGADYRINDDWGLRGAITYDRFTGDAEDSPIVTQGSRDQWGVTLGVTRVLRLGF